MGLHRVSWNVTTETQSSPHLPEYGPFAGDIGSRQNGAMISMSTEKAVTVRTWYAPGAWSALCFLQALLRACWLASSRQATWLLTLHVLSPNQRSSTADIISVQLTPPRPFTLEEALEHIMDDELAGDYTRLTSM